IALPVSRRVRMPRPVYQYVFDFFITCLSIQLVLAPYQSYVFHKVPFASILANTVAVPVSSILIATGMLVAPLSVVSTIPATVSHPLLALFVSCCSFFSGMWVHVVARPAWSLLCLFYLCLLLLLLIRPIYLRLVFGLILCAALLMILHPAVSSHPDIF